MICYLFNIIDFFLLYDCVIHVSTTSVPGWCDMVAELRLLRARTGATPCVR